MGPEFWNSFPAIQYPGARRLSPPVGQGEKREINWNILSGNHGAVSTTPISSKLRKEITVITKEKKIMTIKSLPKNTFLSFTECLNSCACACSVTSWKKREEVKTWNVNIFQKTHLGNKLWVVRERNKCFLPIKHEQLWKSRVLYKACFRTKALPGCYALRALVSVQNINTNKLTWTQHSDIAFFSLMHAPN